MKKLIKNGFNLLNLNISKIQKNEYFNDLYLKYRDFTMISKNLFIENLNLIKDFNFHSPIIVECGVWRGGMVAAINEAFGKGGHAYLFDSFEGLPLAKEIDGENALKWQTNTNGDFYFNNCTADEKSAINAMNMSGGKFTISKGWFEKSIPGFKFEREIDVLRLDCDWYDSTMICLKELYPKVKSNGLIIIDDYYTWEGCSRAVHDYLSDIKSKSRIKSTNRGVCYIKKID